MIIRSVTLWHAFRWIHASWRCLCTQFGGWLMLSLMCLIGLAAMLITPLLGIFIVIFFSPLLASGLLHAADKCYEQQPIQLEDLSFGFREKRRRHRLLLLGGLMLIYVFGLILILYPYSSVLYQNLYRLGEPVPMAVLGYHFIHGNPLLIWLQSLAIIAGIAGFSHSIALVTLGQCSPLSAVMLSSQAFLLNIAPLSMLLLIGSLLVMLATFAFGLGFLIILPLLGLLNYCSYRDIYALRLTDEQLA